MDGESNYESDISESWSLIDINLNEESLFAIDASSELKKSSLSKFKKVKLRKIDEIELDDFVRKCKEIEKTDISQISDSESDSSFKDQKLETCSIIKSDSFLCKKISDEDVKNDSGDAESIEILDIDEHGQDSDVDRLVSNIDPLDFHTYQSDDEEVVEGKGKIRNRSNSSTAIKKRRRNRNSEGTAQNVNSESEYPVKDNLRVCSSDPDEENHIFNVENKVNGHSVYKHYRNNVANTILSLSVGVIFAGVACIAIGHFLGVQDAAETAVELTEALKKLQLENAALQSRLFHLNRALLSREINPKSESTSNQEVFREGIPQLNPSEIRNTDLNKAALSEIRSSLNFIEWLSKLQNFVQKNSKGTETGSGMDFSNFRKYIHDQLNFLDNDRKEEKKRTLEHIGKISKVLHKIFSRLSSYQKNIENIYHETIKLKDKVNQKFNGVLLDPPTISERENKMPVTELDVKKIQWNLKNEINENSEREYSESVTLYKFPQLQKYYEIESNIKSIKETQLETKKSNETLKSSGPKKKAKKEHQKKFKEKKHGRNEWKKELKKKKREKTRKWNSEKNVLEKTESLSKNKDAALDLRHMKYITRQSPFNVTNSQYKKNSNLGEKGLKSKRGLKRPKSSKCKKFLLTESQRDSYLKKNQFSHTCTGLRCFNLTGYWVFKWADGREEIRQHHSLSDWQFERAKGRKEVRDVMFNDNWQFERAKARKKLRVDDYNENWHFKRAFARKNNRDDERWHRGKHTKYNPKDFFHERFSWV